MHNLLNQLLRKRNVEVDSLETSEKATFDSWNKILSSSDVTVEKIKEFCENQIRLIEGKWRNLDNTSNKNDRLITQHSVYKALLQAIDAPTKERENLEKYLVDLIEN
jgi:hypothetical protein